MSTAPLFSPDALKRIVNETLPADAKPGENAIVATVDKTGAKVEAHFRMGDNWQLHGAVAREWDGDITGGAKVVVRW